MKSILQGVLRTMLLTLPHYTPEFLRRNRLGVEFEITRDEFKPEWAELAAFAGGIHLPYRKLNFAALDDKVRRKSLNVIRAAIRKGVGFGIRDMVLHHCGLESVEGVMTGTYDRMIDGLGQLADYAARYRVTLCLENQVQRSPLKVTRFGSSANDWYRILFDLDRPNVMLTLDTSHAASTVAFHPDAAERFRRLNDFLRHPELIRRVHWSDARLGGPVRPFTDWHLIPGDGDLPRAFHRRIKRLNAVKTLEIKHLNPLDMPEDDVSVNRISEADFLRGLAFIRAL